MTNYESIMIAIFICTLMLNVCALALQGIIASILWKSSTFAGKAVDSWLREKDHELKSEVYCRLKNFERSIEKWSNLTGLEEDWNSKEYRKEHAFYLDKMNHAYHGFMEISDKAIYFFKNENYEKKLKSFLGFLKMHKLHISMFDIDHDEMLTQDEKWKNYKIFFKYFNENKEIYEIKKEIDIFIKETTT